LQRARSWIGADPTLPVMRPPPPIVNMELSGGVTETPSS
jgi:hypothetical protein